MLRYKRELEANLEVVEAELQLLQTESGLSENGGGSS